jgi:hypothetical protein
MYMGLIGFALYQSLPSQRTNQRIARITPLFLLSCLANIGWLFTCEYPCHGAADSAAPAVDDGVLILK